MPAAKIKSNNKRNKSKKLSEGTASYINSQLLSFAVYGFAYILACSISLFADLNSDFDFCLCLLAFGGASFVSGFIGGNKVRKKGIATGILYALASNMIAILASLISVGFKCDFRLAITFIILLVTSAVGGIAAVNKRHRR